jgi:hypothetical protein
MKLIMRAAEKLAVKMNQERRLRVKGGGPAAAGANGRMVGRQITGNDAGEIVCFRLSTPWDARPRPAAGLKMTQMSIGRWVSDWLACFRCIILRFVR